VAGGDRSGMSGSREDAGADGLAARPIDAYHTDDVGSVAPETEDSASGSVGSTPDAPAPEAEPAEEDDLVAITDRDEQMDSPAATEPAAELQGSNTQVVSGSATPGNPAAGLCGWAAPASGPAGPTGATGPIGMTG